MIVGEYWDMDVVQLEKAVLASGGGSPPADAFIINGHPGPLYNCSAHGNTSGLNFNKKKKNIYIFKEYANQGPSSQTLRSFTSVGPNITTECNEQVF